MLKGAILLRGVQAGCSSPFHKPLSMYLDKPLKSVTHGQCDAGYLPSPGHHSPLTGTNFYCLVTEAHVYELVLGRYTEKLNRYRIFYNTDTDTDVGIYNTENYRIPMIKCGVGSLFSVFASMLSSRILCSQRHGKRLETMQAARKATTSTI